MRKIIFAFLVLLLLVSPSGLASTRGATEANRKEIIVPDDYDKIQWAIDNATEGDAIYVRSAARARDAIGDTPYVIDANNRDKYPLVSEFTVYDAGTYGGVSFYVDVISNSSVSDFYFNPHDGAFLNFTVTGENVGFCRVSIPKQLLWVEGGGWIVLVDELSVVPSVFESDDFTYLYFTYNHSSRTVHINGTGVISEFPSTAISQLLLIVCFTALILMRRRCVRKET